MNDMNSNIDNSTCLEAISMNHVIWPLISHLLKVISILGSLFGPLFSVSRPV
jgi:hypothetical protein